LSIVTRDAAVVEEGAGEEAKQCFCREADFKEN